MSSMKEQHGMWPDEIENVKTVRFSRTVQQSPQRMRYTTHQVPRRSGGAYSRHPSQQQNIYNDRETERLPVLVEKKSHTKEIVFGMLLVLCIMMFKDVIIHTAQMKYNDVVYGNPRTTQYDFLVGHSGEDAFNKTHFIAVNNKGTLIVLEIHPDTPIATIYQAPVKLYGNEAGDNPLILTLTKGNKQGFPDIIITCGAAHFYMQNDGKQFKFIQIKEGE